MKSFCSGLALLTLVVAAATTAAMSGLYDVPRLDVRYILNALAFSISVVLAIFLIKKREAFAAVLFTSSLTFAVGLAVLYLSYFKAISSLPNLAAYGVICLGVVSLIVSFNVGFWKVLSRGAESALFVLGFSAGYVVLVALVGGALTASPAFRHGFLDMGLGISALFIRSYLFPLAGILVLVFFFARIVQIQRRD